MLNGIHSTLLKFWWSCEATLSTIIQYATGCCAGRGLRGQIERKNAVLVGSNFLYRCCAAWCYDLLFWAGGGRCLLWMCLAREPCVWESSWRIAVGSSRLLLRVKGCRRNRTAFVLDCCFAWCLDSKEMVAACCSSHWRGTYFIGGRSYFGVFDLWAIAHDSAWCRNVYGLSLGVLVPQWCRSRGVSWALDALV